MASQGTKPPAPEGNPAFRMAGLPSRFKLPSRNWLIFFSLVGGLTGAIQYDKRERHRIQEKWCSRVAHLANETLPVNEVRRKITVVLSAFPGDGVIHTREYFHEYIKPILNAAALEWDVVEGLREGDVRYGIAEKVRRYRRQHKEGTTNEWAPELALVDIQAGGDELTEKEKKQIQRFLVEEVRRSVNISDEPGPAGDLIIGRHAWKEYIRGLHEGWLGLADSPARTPEQLNPPPPADYKPPQDPAKAAEAEKERKKRARRMALPATIEPAEYDAAVLPATIPDELAPVSTVPFPHLMGFLNTPKRFYRFLTRRHNADEVGRVVAALVLASASQKFGAAGEASAPEEIKRTLEQEEACWHKSIRKRTAEEAKEEKPPEGAEQAAPTAPKDTVWTDEIALDERIVQRMQKFVATDI